MAIRTLALATDLSERSDRALERALRIAGQHRARLVVIHLVNDSMPADLVERQRRAADDALRNYVFTRPDVSDKDVSVRVVVGDPHAGILHEAGDVAADLLVLGTHRKGALRDLFRGTTIERVIRNSNRPVLVACERATADYRQVAVAVDFSPAARIALKAGLELAPTARFHLVHAFDVPYGRLLDDSETRAELRHENIDRLEAIVTDELMELQRRLSDQPAFAEPRVRQGSVVDVLRSEVETLKADLLFLGTHARTGIGRAVLGSVAETMLAGAPTDILVARAW